MTVQGSLVQPQPEHAGSEAKRIRIERGWSIANAARLAGVSDTTWVNYEHGRPVNEMSASKIAKVLEAGGGEEDAVMRELRLLRAELAEMRAELRDRRTDVGQN